MVSLNIVAVFAVTMGSSAAFCPLSSIRHVSPGTTTVMPMMDAGVMDTAMIDALANVMQQSSTEVGEIMTSSFENTNALAFADQGQNLAGIFFQASLIPYLLFLYFLSFRANRINNIGNLGFQFILLFVMSTIPAGIISKLTYGTSLANVDWLHGGAELLLTVANVLVVRAFCASTITFFLSCHYHSSIFSEYRFLASKKPPPTPIHPKST